ncbi:MAG: response regulator [Asticcacaulis sp.]
MKLLCVEDNGAIQGLIGSMLLSGGAEVDYASNGREAVEAYELTEYDAILMDMEMPVMSGIEATKEIRQIEYGFHLHHTPILFLTGHEDATRLAQVEAVGGDGHLCKPFTPEALLLALNGVLSLQADS